MTSSFLAPYFVMCPLYFGSSASHLLLLAGWWHYILAAEETDANDDYGPVCIEPLSSNFVQASHYTNKAGKSTHWSLPAPHSRESYIFLMLARTGSSPDAVMSPLGATGLPTALMLLLTGIFLFPEEAVRLTIKVLYVSTLLCRRTLLKPPDIIMRSNASLAEEIISCQYGIHSGGVAVAPPSFLQHLPFPKLD